MNFLKKVSKHESLNDGINNLFEAKPKSLVIRKVIEELSELTTVLIQYDNDNSKICEDEIAEELVDVAMNIQLLSKYYDKDYLLQCLEDKVKKFKSGSGYKNFVKTK